jgi:cytoskeletal protein CcmA (bactofilin family)
MSRLGHVEATVGLATHLEPVLQMSILSRRRGAPTAPAGSGYSLLDSQLTVTGDLETAGSLRIDGRLDGTVRRADAVVVGVGASTSGDIHAREVVIGGTVNGTVHATERVELQATAIVTGDIVTQSVLVQEGGVVNGRVLMRPPEAAASDSSSGATGKPAHSIR